MPCVIILAKNSRKFEVFNEKGSFPFPSRPRLVHVGNGIFCVVMVAFIS